MRYGSFFQKPVRLRIGMGWPMQGHQTLYESFVLASVGSVRITR